jgi:hypothetical protein
MEILYTNCEGCTHIAFEATGIYWKPVFNLLEGSFEVLVVNAQHIKAVPGRKTDVKDTEWLEGAIERVTANCAAFHSTFSSRRGNLFSEETRRSPRNGV